MKLGEATHEMLIYQRSVVAAVDPVYFSCSEDLSYSAAFMFCFIFILFYFFWEAGHEVLYILHKYRQLSSPR